MARPNKQGLDYFSFDVDFFEDEKIEAISGEFGIKGEIATIKLLCAVYRNGYFILWSDMLKMKLLKNLPGISSELLDAILNRLVVWDFFDKSLFDSVGVLTSKGIQRRFFEATKRRQISENLPYILINADNNEVNAYNNSSRGELLHTKTTQSKVKKSKVKKKEENIPPISPEGEIEIPFDENFETSCKPQGEKEKSSAKKEKEPNHSFEEFWNLYDKKTGEKKKLAKKWLALTDEEREAIMNYIPKYIACQPDKQFRKNPETFLNNKSWNDELIPRNNGNRQLPASDKGYAGRNTGPSGRNDADNKRAERDRLNEMARAILRGTPPQNT